MKQEFLELDFDGDGSVSTKEIEKVLHSLRIKLKLNEGDIRKLLQEIDKDGNGVLATSEIKQLWNIAPSDEKTKKLSDAEMNEMIKAIDTNEDGQIDYEEFVTLMTS